MAAACTARSTELLDPLGRTNPGTSIASARPRSPTSRIVASRSGPSPRISARNSGNSRRARAIAGGIEVMRFSGIWRPTNTTSGSDRDRVRLERALILAREDLSLRRPAPPREPLCVQAREAECPLRYPNTDQLDQPAELAGQPSEVLPPVFPGPHLVPVDHEPVAPQRASTAAASSEKYGNDAVWTTS